MIRKFWPQIDEESPPETEPSPYKGYIQRAFKEELYFPITNCSSHHSYLQRKQYFVSFLRLLAHLANMRCEIAIQEIEKLNGLR